MKSCALPIRCTRHATDRPKRRERERRSSMPPRASDSGVAQWLEQNYGAVTSTQHMGGSSWSNACVYGTAGGRKLFVKTALGRDADNMFAGEALGLQAMHATHTLRVPQVLHWGPLPARPSGSFIVMEYLQFSGRVDQAELGTRLAKMHLADPRDTNAQAGQFGFPLDNHIGGTPQPNSWDNNWVNFFRERRLRHQLRLANDASLTRMGEVVCKNLDAFFEGIEVRPSILHGDLWSGNIAAVGSEPCIFDPASYFGHHEAEFGMSWCAGFGSEFWSAYNALVPRAKGWEARHELYTLYHYLNHYNLFGGGYYSQCVQMLTRLTDKL